MKRIIISDATGEAIRISMGHRTRIVTGATRQHETDSMRVQAGMAVIAKSSHRYVGHVRSVTRTIETCIARIGEPGILAADHWEAVY